MNRMLYDMRGASFKDAVGVVTIFGILICIAELIGRYN